MKATASRLLVATILLTLIARPALAQSEEVLRTAFEGKTIRLKLDMPGASAGVDVRPGTARPVDFAQHATRLKNFGTAYRTGDVAQVTKVHINGDHIEFQLGGGGFGTMGDDASTTVSITSAPKTQREKDLERDIKKVTDATEKKKMQEELDRLSADRRKEDNRNQARANEAQALKEANVREKRLAGGSRFNIRYDKRIPDEALTPQSVMTVLADYVDFTGMSGAAVASAPTVGGDLRKGMLVDDVDALLGRPESITSRSEGTLTVSTSTYRNRSRVVTAEFVEGVLIHFRVVSN